MKAKTTRAYNKNLLIGILILVPALLFVKTLSYDFSPIDEQWLIVRRFDYLKHWNNIFNAFCEPAAPLFYRPFLTLSFMLDAHTGQLNPMMYHLTNLLLHIACVLLVYRLLIVFKTPLVPAFLFSLLFAVHPSLVHAIVWIPGRNDLLLCLFSLLAMLALISYLENKRVLYLFLHLTFFSCALLTKEVAIVLPFVFLALIIVQEAPKTTLTLLLPGWFLLALSWYFIKKTVIDGTVLSFDHLGLSLENSVSGFFVYVGKLLWPFSASVNPTVKNASLLAGLVTLIILFVLAYKFGFRNKRVAFFGAFVFLSVLAPTVYYAASTPPGTLYEHRMYLPFAGFILLASQLKLNLENGMPRFVFLLMTVLLAGKTLSRSHTYKTNLSYLNEGIKVSPDYYFFYSLKGDILYDKHQMREALVCYNKSLALRPGLVSTYTNRANVYAELRQKDKALADLDSALKLRNTAQIHLNRLNVCCAYGDYEKALSDFAFLEQRGGNYVNAIDPVALNKLKQVKNGHDNKVLAR